jgi:molybdopterin molybdotransferase
VISPEEAWRRIEEHLAAAGLAPLPEEAVARRRAAGRVLARGLTARVDVPGEDVSAMDGYAVNGAAAPLAPGEVRPVALTVVAGDAPGLRLEAPAVVRIMTGAPVPAEADRVIPVERATPAPDGRSVALHDPGQPGDHIRRRGEVLRAGAPLLPAGALLTPGALALLATHGYGEVPVHRSPKVALVATGDEVVPPESEPAPGQLRDSHTDFLLAAGASLGLSFEPLGIAPDREDALAPLLARGLAADVLLVTGGVSMGELDLVEGVLARHGCRVLFDAVAIQPGKPLVFAVHERGIAFGLPGNPASVMVGFWLFVRPALRRMLGHDDGYWRGALAATLAAALPAGGARERFLPAEVEVRDGRIVATAHPPKGSHDVAAYAKGAALLRVPIGAPPRSAGEPCEVLPLAGWIP